MRKKAGIIGSCVIITIVGVVACGVQELGNNGAALGQLQDEQSAMDGDKAGDHLSMRIGDNVEIDADIENNQVKNCIVYKTTGKEFDIDTLKEILWNDTPDLIQEEEEQNGSFQITDTKGGSLYAEAGRLEYQQKEGMVDLLMLVKYCFWNKINNMDAKKLEALSDQATVKNTVAQLSQVYILEDEEEFCLQKGVKISMTDVIKKQKEMTKNLITQSETQRLTKKYLGKDAYYLSFTVEKQGIPMASDNEPGFLPAEGNPNVQTTNVELIVDENGIQYLSIRGAFVLEENKEENIITAQEAVQYIKNGYDDQIIEESRTFDNVWLEYAFVSTTSFEDYHKGTLEPYWVFVDSENDIAERINAITGDNFRYQ